jgi:hypothetical protein
VFAALGLDGHRHPPASSFRRRQGRRGTATVATC